MEINQPLSEPVAERRFSLILNGVNVCNLTFDGSGKYTIGLTKIDDIHKFCRVALAVIDDLPTGESLFDGLPTGLKAGFSGHSGRRSA